MYKVTLETTKGIFELQIENLLQLEVIIQRYWDIYTGCRISKVPDLQKGVQSNGETTKRAMR